LFSLNRARAIAEKRNKSLEDELDALSQTFEDEKKKREEFDAVKQGLERELSEVKDKLIKVATETDNTIAEALKSERAKNAALQERLTSETGRRTAIEDRYQGETNKVSEMERKIREIREILRQ
jgi:chromosome segregation ATPase